MGAAGLGKLLNANLDEISSSMVPTILGRMQKLRDETLVHPLHARVLDAMEAHVVSSARRWNVASVRTLAECLCSA